VVVIDPRRTASCDIADLHLALDPGSDAWLFNGLLDYLKREDAIDWAYLEAHVEGFGEALKAVNGLGSPQVAQHCGLAEADVAAFYRLFAMTPKTVTLFSQGINQSSSGVDKGNAIINAHLATGRVGKPGASPFSLTGQPNAMGGREVGGLANQLAAHMDFTPGDIERVGRFWNAANMARQPGLKAVDMFEAVRDGRIKAIWIMATNPVVSLPEAGRVAEALKACEFVVVSDNTRHTDTTQYAHVLLPAAAWGEKDGSVTNSERRISRQRAFLPLPGEARPDWWIVSEVARRMGFGEGFDYDGPAAIFREYAALSSFENGGERDFDLGGLADLTANDYATLMPVQWPLASKHQAGTQRLFAGGKFFTPAGKARMLAVAPRAPANEVCASTPFVFNTGRIRDQWHTMTRTGKAAKLLAHIDEPYVEMHPQDAQRAGVQAGALARIRNGNGEMLARVQTSADQRPGSVFAPIHWNGRFTASGRVDALVPAVTDPISGQPEFKHAPVSVEAYPAAWHGFVISRAEFDCRAYAYWTRVRGNGCWRHELADTGDGVDWADTLHRAFGNTGDWIELRDSAAQRYRAALLRDGQLEAVCFIERTPAMLPQRQWLASLFEKNTLGNSERIALLSGRPPGAQTDCGRVVCACFGVGENTLREAITLGADSVEALGIRLKAGSNCGSCIPELRKLLADTAAKGEERMPLAAAG
jgi:assimilatory nitrate reductase catalytic subunit